MSRNDDGPIDRALGWILAIALVAGKALKWLLLWPYELVTTYLAIGEKCREAAEGDGEADDPGSGGNTDPGGGPEFEGDADPGGDPGSGGEGDGAH